MYDLSAYLPDALVPQYEAVRNQLVGLLELLGIAKAPTTTNKGPGTFYYSDPFTRIVRRARRHVEGPEGTERRRA